MDVLGELVFGVVVCNMEGVFREGEEDVMVVIVVVDLGVGEVALSLVWW
jgi:hypothetical protein